MKKVICAAIGISLAVPPALANAPFESRPYQFRSANDRQVLSNIERTRLELRGDLGVGGAAGLGGVDQIGNFIQVIGDNNTVSETDQNNTGDQRQTTGNNSPIVNDDNNFLNVDGGN